MVIRGAELTVHYESEDEYRQESADLIVKGWDIWGAEPDKDGGVDAVYTAKNDGKLIEIPEIKILKGC